MSATRSTARHVRQRKLNTKQGLRIIREHEIEETPDDEASRQIPQLETGVEKGEEVEIHLQAVINANNAAALGVKAQQSYIPTPEAVRATGVKFDELYPKKFTEPSTYIRFSSTVEDCIGVAYCMNEDDERFLAQLNDGKDVNGQPVKDKSKQCSELAFEEAINFFEDVSQREQPFANLGSAPLLTLEEMREACDEPLSDEARYFLDPIYQYWASRKGDRAMMPSIKVRVLDATSEADEADPYVCFRRREVRQTRKTRGRDAQIVEKLKKLRWELDQGRSILELCRHREELAKARLENDRKLFEQRHAFKEVKISQQIIGEKGEDEELLVNQKPLVKANRSGGGQQRPTTLRLHSRSTAGGNAPENDLNTLADMHEESEKLVSHQIESRKDQHRRWNQNWQDETWYPLTPPPDGPDENWGQLPLPKSGGYPTPPPSVPSRGSQDRDGDMEMTDTQPAEEDATAGAEDFRLSFVVAPQYPLNTYPAYQSMNSKGSGALPCRIRRGRGGRLHLEARKPRARGLISRGVVSDSESDDDSIDYYPVSEGKAYDYRVAMNNRARPGPDGARPSGDQTTIMAGAQAAAVTQAQPAASGSNS